MRKQSVQSFKVPPSYIESSAETKAVSHEYKYTRRLLGTWGKSYDVFKLALLGISEEEKVRFLEV